MKNTFTRPARIYKWEGKVVTKATFIKLAKENWSEEQLKASLIFYL